MPSLERDLANKSDGDSSSSDEGDMPLAAIASKAREKRRAIKTAARKGIYAVYG